METEAMNIFNSTQTQSQTQASNTEEVWDRLCAKSIGKYKLSYLRDVYNQMTKFNKINEEYLESLLEKCPTVSSLDRDFNDKFLEILGQCIPYDNFSYDRCRQLKTDDEMQVYLKCLQGDMDYNAFLSVQQKYSLTIQETELLLSLDNFVEETFLRYRSIGVDSLEALQLFKIKEYARHQDIISFYIGKVPVCVISALCIFEDIGIDISNFNRLEILFYNHSFWLERLGLREDYVVGLEETYTGRDIELLKQIWIYLTGDINVVTNEAYALDDYIVELACARVDKDSNCTGLKREPFSRNYQYVIFADEYTVSFFEDAIPYVYSQLVNFLNSVFSTSFYDIVFDCNSKYALGIHVKRTERASSPKDVDMYMPVTDETKVLSGIGTGQFNKFINTMYQIGSEIKFYEWNTLMALTLLKLQGYPYLDWFSKIQNSYIALSGIFKTYVFASIFGDKSFSILLDKPDLFATLLSLKDCMHYNTSFNNAVFLLATRKVGWLFRAEELPSKIKDNLEVCMNGTTAFKLPFRDLLLNFDRFNHPHLQNRFCRISETEDSIVLRF